MQEISRLMNLEEKRKCTQKREMEIRKTQLLRLQKCNRQVQDIIKFRKIYIPFQEMLLSKNLPEIPIGIDHVKQDHETTHPKEEYERLSCLKMKDQDFLSRLKQTLSQHINLEQMYELNLKWGVINEKYFSIKKIFNFLIRKAKFKCIINKNCLLGEFIPLLKVHQLLHMSNENTSPGFIDPTNEKIKFFLICKSKFRGKSKFDNFSEPTGSLLQVHQKIYLLILSTPHQFTCLHCLKCLAPNCILTQILFPGTGLDFLSLPTKKNFLGLTLEVKTFPFI
jgi:hypothetical protein